MVANSRRLHDRLRKMIVFAMLGTLMFVSKVVMEGLPNIHLLGALTVIYTIVYRAEALIPIYICVFLTGIYAGFAPWWVPYCYVWAILWGVTMLLPKKLPKYLAAYVAVCTLHGLLFGVLYAPAQAWMYGYDFSKTVVWIITGIPADIIHGIGNFVASTLILPLSTTLTKLERRFSMR